MSNATVRFSLYKDEDHDGFFSCINEFYKGGYPYKEYLDRENLKRLLSSGDMVITLAKDETGRIVGTSSALRMSGVFEGSVLLLLRSVLKEMRGRGIGTEQELFLLAQIESRFPDAMSIYADVMTHDAASQSTMLHRGFAFCGLRMTLYKNEIMVSGLPYERGTKMTQAIYCKRNQNIGERLLFAPKECFGTLQEIYANLGVPVALENDVASEGECQYRMETSELHQKAELFAEGHGDTQKMQDEMQKLLSAGYTAVAYLNMSVRGCTQTYKALKKLGFYFSGIKPLSERGEYLLLSHSKNCVLSLENIKLPEGVLPAYIAKEIENEA